MEMRTQAPPRTILSTATTACQAPDSLSQGDRIPQTLVKSRNLSQPSLAHLYNGPIEALVLAAPSALGCSSPESTHSKTHKYLQASSLHDKAPSFSYPLLKPQLLTPCLAPHRHWTPICRVNDVYSREIKTELKNFSLQSRFAFVSRVILFKCFSSLLPIT